MTNPDISSRRRTSWPQGLAAGLAVVAIYFLSYGPAGWIVWKMDDPQWARSTAAVVYWPVEELIRSGPDPVSHALWKYLHFWRD